MQDAEFLEFLETIQPGDRPYAMELNRLLLERGCKREIKAAKSGPTVSYLAPGSKKTLATFVCRKTGIKLRIFPQRLHEYEGFLDTLPERMKQEIRRASPCKRMLNPGDCNPKCAMGYDFVMDGERHRKCRYMAFMPTLTGESAPFLQAFLEKELSEG